MALKRPFPELDWHLTPQTVRQYILYLEQTLHDMQLLVESHEKRIEKLEVQTKNKFSQLQQTAVFRSAFCQEKAQAEKEPADQGRPERPRTAPTANA